MQLLNLTPLDALFDPHVPALTSTAPTSRFATATRSHLGGELRASHVGAKVKLGGWVHRTRNLGGIVFLDLRDRAGLVQISFDPKWTPADVIERAGKLGLETVITLEGEVAARPVEMRNAEMETGEIEVRARDFKDRRTGRDSSDPRRARQEGRSFPPRSCASSIATSICAASSCRRISFSGIDSSRRRAAFSMSVAFSRSRLRSSPSRLPKARATTSCRAAFIRASSTRSRSRRSYTSSC